MRFSFNSNTSHRARQRAAALVVALGLAAGHAQAALVTTSNTGTATPVPTPLVLPAGSLDPHYIRVVAVGGSTGGVGLGPSEVASFIPGTWLSASGSSAWIKPAFAPTPPPFTSSYYQTTFNLSGLNPATAIFSGRFATDDPGGRIYLNGQDLLSVGGTYGVSVPGAWTGFGFNGSSLAAGAFNPAVNYLTFQVDHFPGPVFNPNTGLRVEYSGDALPVPEPASYALFGLGLTTVALLRRRRPA